MSTINGCLETTSGLYFDYLDPQPEQVNVEDIARALSQIPRFAGQTSAFYSVAEHVLAVARIVGPNNARVQLAALHHDSHEAYLGDVPSPLKALLGETYTKLRVAADVAIGTKLRVHEDTFHNSMVVAADRLALRVEAAYLKHSHGIGEHWGYDGVPPEALNGRPTYMTPQQAETEFLIRHDVLMRRLHGRTWR